jgi:2-polyprenyl-3-methyl-5-hydroxy-6-metoxy-1,4-benzoquinol methylase
MHESHGTPHLDRLLDRSYHQSPSSGVWSRDGYSGIRYSDGDEVEERLLKVISEASDISVLSRELRSHCSDWPSLYHLSGSRANVLRPVSHLFSGQILEIGAGCGAITRYLGELGHKVVALEGSLRRAAIARARTRDLTNVTVVSDKFSDFQCDGKFDVITLIGVFEYAALFTPGGNPGVAMLQKVKQLLKPHGLLVIAIENKLGLKYFAGADEDHVGRPMFGIEDRYTNNGVRTYGRVELAKILAESGFSDSNFMACFPDYKIPFSVVTTSGASELGFDASALAWQSVAKDHLKPPFRCFSPELTWSTIFQNQLGIDLANSFLVIAGQNLSNKFDSQILGYHYSSDRRPELTKESIFRRESDRSISVHCKSLVKGLEAMNSKTKLGDRDLAFHVPNHSTYQFGKPFSMQFVRIVSTPGWTHQALKDFFTSYTKELFRLGQVSDIHSAQKIPGSLIDCIPNNLIELPDGKLAVIDNEWTYTGSVPIKKIIFRALLSLASIPSDYEKDETGTIYSFRELFILVYRLLEILVTENELLELLKDEIALQNTVTGLNNDANKTWDFFALKTPSAKYLELMPQYAAQIGALSSELHAIRSSRKWRIALKISQMTPRFLKSAVRALLS